MGCWGSFFTYTSVSWDVVLLSAAKANWDSEFEKKKNGDEITAARMAKIIVW